MMDNFETIWAEVKVDCYNGEECRNHRNVFDIHSQGDMDSDEIEVITFDASQFPPGTKLVISEPACPECQEIPTRSREKEHVDTSEDGVKIHDYIWRCGCDFNWRDFAENQYS